MQLQFNQTRHFSFYLVSTSTGAIAVLHVTQVIRGLVLVFLWAFQLPETLWSDRDLVAKERHEEGVGSRREEVVQVDEQGQGEDGQAQGTGCDKDSAAGGAEAGRRQRALFQPDGFNSL